MNGDDEKDVNLPEDPELIMLNETFSETKPKDKPKTNDDN